MSTFNNGVKDSKVKQHIVWVAEYLNGTSLSEFVPTADNELETSFYDIETDKLSKFGLVGCGHNFWFDVATGTLYIDDKPIDIMYNNTCITQDGSRYDDIITFKDAAFDVSLGGKRASAPVITNYHVGYKKSMSINGAIVHYKLIFNVPTDGKPITLEVSMSSDIDLDGTIKFMRNGVVLDSYEAYIGTGNTGKLNWVVK